VPLAKSYEHDIEISGSMKGDDFLDCLSNPGAELSSMDQITQRKLNLSHKSG
jgi:hypothetical protein